MCFDISVGLSFSGENATVTYHLQFGVPEDDDFMKYMMSEELVLGILMQNFHDQNVPGCESLGLDPTSFLLYGKQYKQENWSWKDGQVNRLQKIQDGWASTKSLRDSAHGHKVVAQTSLFL